MDTTEGTSIWTVLLQQFSPAFTAPGARLFLDLVSGWGLCTARRTITGIVPFADPKGRHAHDAFALPLIDSDSDPNDSLWTALFAVVAPDP